MGKKPARQAERREVIYSSNHWDLLKELRSLTIQVMSLLDQYHLYSVVHGSISRGDVSEQSDVDVFLPDLSSSFILEIVLDKSNFVVDRRFIIQATPTYAAKGYIKLDQRVCLSFPLAKLRRIERDFYKFSGEMSIDMLKKNRRVPGVDKRLMLIEPTIYGHVESAISGQEETVAQHLDISRETVFNRQRALLRRNKIGRTGVFIEKELEPDETFELALKRLADRNPAVRRRCGFTGT